MYAEDELCLSELYNNECCSMLRVCALFFSSSSFSFVDRSQRERERDKESDREKEEDILQYINLQRNNKIQNDDSKVDVQTVANAIVFV